MKKYFIGLIIIVLMVSACNISQNIETDEVMEKENSIVEHGSEVLKDNMKPDDAMGNVEAGRGDIMEEDTAKDSMQENMEVMEKEENMMEDKAEFKGNVLAGEITPYLDFNQEDYDKAIDDGKIVLLYFYANWCPICKAEQKVTFEAFNELRNEDVVGFRVNYKDSETDSNEEQLAKNFGVTYQHTKVIIKNGERVLKAPDSWNKARYLEEINKVA